MSIPLPFVIQPKRKPEKIKIGTEESGIIEILRYGYLTTGEKGAFQQVETNKEGSAKMREVVDIIVKESGRSQKEVLADFTRLGTDKSLPEYLEAFAVEITEVLKSFDRDSTHTALVKALCLVISRIDAEATLDDLLEFHPDLINALAELFDAEEARSLAALPSEYSDKVQQEEETNSVKAAATRQIKGGKPKAQAQS